MPAKSVKVLIVEDEPMLQEAYRHVLDFTGYVVSVANNGAEALDLLPDVKPDVVLLDVLMPQLDGIGFLQRADLAHAYPATKVIVCTNLSDHITAEQVTAFNIDRQVLKSDLSPAQLVAVVQELTNQDTTHGSKAETTL